MMQAGFDRGSIWDPETGPMVYSLSRCYSCSKKVDTWDEAGRHVYACSTCQAVQPGSTMQHNTKAKRKRVPTSAADAAKAKRQAGESASKQHVAMMDDEKQEMMQAAKRTVKKQAPRKIVKKQAVVQIDAVQRPVNGATSAKPKNGAGAKHQPRRSARFKA